MKLFHTTLTFALIIGFITPSIVSASAITSRDTRSGTTIEVRTFITTAYYSPLPGQSRYLRGNYEAELRLNGNGTHGASGKAVYSGMLAAPKTYAFGTKIYIPGLGTGSVEDRGGAIVNAGQRGHAYDRIDIWMGYGEEGLKRALTWGKRTVTGHIALTPIKAINTFELPETPKISLAAILPVSHEKKNISNTPLKTIISAPKVTSDIFNMPISTKSSGTSIQALSEVLYKLGYLTTKPSSTFSPDLTLAIIRFQSEKSLITSANSAFAGTYGPNTRKALAAAYSEYQDDMKAIDAELVTTTDILTKSIAKSATEYKTKNALLDGIEGVKLGDTGAHIRELQNSLSTLGFYKEKTTGIFGPKTREAIIQFQLHEKLVSSLADPNAGKIGKITKARLVASLVEA